MYDECMYLRRGSGGGGGGGDRDRERARVPVRKVTKRAKNRVARLQRSFPRRIEYY